MFKLKKTSSVKKIICQNHNEGEWQHFKDGWEVKEAALYLKSWQEKRRVIIVRQRLSSGKEVIGLEHQVGEQRQLAFLDGPEDMRSYKYAVLVTNTDDEPVTLLQHYRDRADCENNFDEIKNQWGWGGYTTRDLQSCRLMSRYIALVYNWWTLFVRLIYPDNHMEAITSRPLLLSSVGRITTSSRQRTMKLTSSHRKSAENQSALTTALDFLKQIKEIAPQLGITACWHKIVIKSVEKFTQQLGQTHYKI